MAGRNIDPRDVYELMENDNGEIMVLLYAGDTDPLNPFFKLNKQRKCIELSRNAKDVVLIEGLIPDSIEKLSNLKTLYVCELKYTENADEDSEILYAYPAELKSEEIAKDKAANESNGASQTAKESLSVKVKQAREKTLSKR